LQASLRFAMIRRIYAHFRKHPEWRLAGCYSSFQTIYMTFISLFCAFLIRNFFMWRACKLLGWRTSVGTLFC
jgi:hypothetical protein